MDPNGLSLYLEDDLNGQIRCLGVKLGGSSMNIQPMLSPGFPSEPASPGPVGVDSVFFCEFYLEVQDT